MKILTPYKVQNGVSIHSSVVSGGIEKFIKTTYELFDEIIPIEITEDHRKKNKVKSVLMDAVRKEKPDMIFTNYDEEVYSTFFLKMGIPVSMIVHVPLIRHIRYIQMLKNLKNFTDNGGHLYFVSKNQYEYLSQMSHRLYGHKIENVKGFINPAYTEDTFLPSEDIEYDAITVGRSEALKNPFWIHKKLKNTNKKSLVVTNSGSFLRNDKHDKYYFDNLDWKEPQETKRDMQHKDVIKHIAKSVCYISTCPDESWGISALEALSCGVPLIIVTNKSDKHSSTEIAANSKHYKLVRSNIKQDDIIKVIDEFSKLTYQDRMEISRQTKEKHTKNNFVGQIRKIFDDRFQDKIIINSIESFLL
jgi:glycosyltransferase involved in cell wall biosynthesis